MSSIIVLDSSDEESEQPMETNPRLSPLGLHSVPQLGLQTAHSRAGLQITPQVSLRDLPSVGVHTMQPISTPMHPQSLLKPRQLNDAQNSLNSLLKSKYYPPSTSDSAGAIISQAATAAQTCIRNGEENNLKRRLSNVSDSSINDKSTKRVKPTLISKKVDSRWFAAQSPVIAVEENDKKAKISELKSVSESSKDAHKVENDVKPEEDESKSSESKEGNSEETAGVEPENDPVNPVFDTLLKACKEADPSSDMDKLIENKLLRYYHSVHPDFVNSKGFCKTVKAVTEEIKNMPQLVYYKLKTVVEELKIRKKSKSTVISNEEITTTGSARKDGQVKRLSKALYILTKKIQKLEEADVDLNDENSSYLQVERFKKRACEIYEKICDLTGESKHAHRSVKKPISFSGTSYPQFNRTLQAFVNRTNIFPDYLDVLKILEHCNAQYGFSLRNDDVKRIAQEAFLTIGKLLQNRRKTDLYETVAHFTTSVADPAEADPDLAAKLTENQKHHSKISSIIDLFAKEQELEATKIDNEKAISAQAAINEISNSELNVNGDSLAETSNKENEPTSPGPTTIITVGLNGNAEHATPKDKEKQSEIDELAAVPVSDTNKNITPVALDEIVISDEEDL